jgi:hypothetical protein
LNLKEIIFGLHVSLLSYKELVISCSLETHLNQKRTFSGEKKNDVKNILHLGMQIKFDFELKGDYFWQKSFFITI